MVSLEAFLQALPIRDVLAYTAAKHSNVGGAKVVLDLEQAAEFAVVDAIDDKIRFGEHATDFPELVPMCFGNIAIGVRQELLEHFGPELPPVRVLVRVVRPDVIESNEGNHRLVGAKAIQLALEQTGSV